MDKRQYLRDYYLKNKERLKEYHIKWYRENRERLILKDREYKRVNKDHVNKIRKSYPSYLAHGKTRDPVKNRVRNKLQYAVKKGYIVRLPCEICGNLKSQAHHEDYSKPLEVKWLCALHHAEFHKNVL